MAQFGSGRYDDAVGSFREAALLAPEVSVYSCNEGLACLLAGRPDRIITSSFWHFPRKQASRAIFVGPFISGKLKQLRGARGFGLEMDIRHDGVFPHDLRLP